MRAILWVCTNVLIVLASIVVSFFVGLFIGNEVTKIYWANMEQLQNENTQLRNQLYECRTLEPK